MPKHKDYIPENCFIDYRDFKNDEELVKFLENLNLNDINNYLYNAYEFLLSEGAKRNRCEYFANKIFRNRKKLTKTKN